MAQNSSFNGTVSLCKITFPQESAMPSLSTMILGGHHTTHHHHQPFYTFHGPDTNGQVQALNASQVEVARFVILKHSVTRLRPSQQPVCSIKTSSLSGTMTLDFPSQQVKLRDNGKEIHVPSLGILKWKSGSDGIQELRDGGKLVLARGRISGTWNKRGEGLEIMVPGDEFLLDVIMASWVLRVQELESEGQRKGLESVADVVSALAGG